MNIFLLLVLGLTAVAIPAARVMAVKNGADKWDRTQKHNLYNLGWVAGVFVVYLLACITVSIPWWVGLILLLPVLALCVWSLIAAYDWDVTPDTFGARMNQVTYGDGSLAAVKFREKYRRFAGMGILGFLVIAWISVAIVGAFSDGSATQAQPPAATTPATQAPATTAPTTEATPSTPPTSSAPASPSTSTTESSNCMDSIPVKGAVDESYTTTTAPDATDIQVCHAGKHWGWAPVKGGQVVQVYKWVKDDQFAYTLIGLNGKQVWTRTPLDK